MNIFDAKELIESNSYLIANDNNLSNEINNATFLSSTISVNPYEINDERGNFVYFSEKCNKCIQDIRQNKIDYAFASGIEILNSENKPSCIVLGEAVKLDLDEEYSSECLFNIKNNYIANFSSRKRELLNKYNARLVILLITNTHQPRISTFASLYTPHIVTGVMNVTPDYINVCINQGKKYKTKENKIVGDYTLKNTDNTIYVPNINATNAFTLYDILLANNPQNQCPIPTIKEFEKVNAINSNSDFSK